MKKSKWALMCLLGLCMLALSGCRLALEEKAVSRDRFVGASVILRDSFGSANGCEDRSQPHEPDGELLIVKFEEAEDGVPRIGSEESECFTEVKNNYHVKDFESAKGESFNVEATLYLCEEKLPPHARLEMERVYQREDGTIYAVDGGTSYALSGQDIRMGSLGFSLSESWKAESSEGLAEEFTVSVKLNVKAEKEVLSAALIEMDSANQEIARHELAGEEEVCLTPAASWALMEETLADGSIRRTAVNLTDGEGNVTVRWTNSKAMCIPMRYKLLTPGRLSEPGAA